MHGMCLWRENEQINRTYENDAKMVSRKGERQRSRDGGKNQSASVFFTMASEGSPRRSSKSHGECGLLAKRRVPGYSLLGCLLLSPGAFWSQFEHFPPLFQKRKYIRAHYVPKGEKSGSYGMGLVGEEWVLV